MAILAYAKPLIIYGSPFVIILGTIGNIISFAVYCTKKLNRTSFSVFIRVLAVSDTVFLLNDTTNYWFREIDEPIRKKHDILCKLNNFLSMFSKSMSAWILALIAIERVVGTLMPFKRALVYTQKML